MGITIFEKTPRVGSDCATGALLAVPLLMLLKIASDHSDRLAPLGNLLQR